MLNSSAANQTPTRGVWHLVTGGRAILTHATQRMQELVLIQPSGTVTREGKSASSREAADLALRHEFEERLAECGPLAFRVARGVLRNTADAEDAAQEALLRAYKRFHRLRDRNLFRAWLVRITFRLALDKSRSAKRREVRETSWSMPENRPPVETAEDLAVSSQFQEHLDAALAELPEKLRLTLLLSAMESHTLDEVASILKIPLGTVKSRIFSARKLLAEKLQWHVKNIKKR